MSPANVCESETEIALQPTSAKSAAALAREREYQRHSAEAARNNVTATSSRVMERYASLRYANVIQKDFLYRALGVGGDLDGKTVLDFGCGTGETTTQLALFGGVVMGMDISPELIAVAQRRAELDGVAGRIQLLAVDLLRNPPPPNSFDRVLCSAVLHHVDYRVVLPVLRNCLRPGGKIALGEPTAMSPALARLRDWLPVEKNVSPDERQFNAADVAAIASAFDCSEVRYFNLFSRVIRFLPMGLNLEQAPALIRCTVVFLMTLDSWLAKSSLLHRFFGAVAIVGTKLA